MFVSAGVVIIHFDDALIIRLVYKHSKRVNKGSDSNCRTAIQWPYRATRDELILAITSFYLCVFAGKKLQECIWCIT